MKNFTRTLVASLVLMTGQLAHASEILDQNWLENQANDYVQVALSTLDLTSTQQQPALVVSPNTSQDTLVARESRQIREKDQVSE